MFIKKQEIVAFEIGGAVVCVQCASERELLDIEQEKVITRSALDGNMIFCDRHGKRIG